MYIAKEDAINRLGPVRKRERVRGSPKGGSDHPFYGDHDARRVRYHGSQHPVENVGW